MTLFEILLLSASLSVDSFAVSMGGSVSLGRPSAGKTLSVAAVFGTVQSMFLFAGWAAGYSVVSYISPAAHVLAFVILAYIGGSMLFSAFRNDEGGGVDIAGTKRLLAAAVASSIDAAAVGVSLAMADTEKYHTDNIKSRNDKRTESNDKSTFCMRHHNRIDLTILDGKKT